MKHLQQCLCALQNQSCCLQATQNTCSYVKPYFGNCRVEYSCKAPVSSLCPDMPLVWCRRSYFYNLAQLSLVERYALPPAATSAPAAGNNWLWLKQHQQRLIEPSASVQKQLEGVIDLDRYVPEQGFVGFGHNLVHLNPAQLRLQIKVEAPTGGQLAAASRWALHAPCTLIHVQVQAPRTCRLCSPASVQPASGP